MKVTTLRLLHMDFVFILRFKLLKNCEADGISAHILDLRTVYPLDKEAIIEAASKTGKVLLVNRRQ